jgi:hypothetical protein
MKVIFKYLLIDESKRGLSSWLLYRAEAINAPKGGFNKYLLPALDTDFPAHHPEDCDEVLADIEKLEHGEIDHCMAGTVDTFMHTITRTKVTFEHSIFGECPEWPLWSCTLAQYKAALQGWRKFIDMPKSIDSELIIELPDGTP